MKKKTYGNPKQPTKTPNNKFGSNLVPESKNWFARVNGWMNPAVSNQTP
jgi:hypothetical protein